MSTQAARRQGRSWPMSRGRLACPTRRSRACSTATRTSAPKPGQASSPPSAIWATARTPPPGRSSPAGPTCWASSASTPRSTARRRCCTASSGPPIPATRWRSPAWRALTARSLPEAVERFLGQAVDGIIVIAPETAAVEALAELAARRSRWSRWDAAPALRCPRWPSTTLSGAAQATRHLLDLGHRDGAPYRRPGQLV